MGEQPVDPCDIRIVAYITTWCPDCVRSRRVLQRAGYPFVEIDIERIHGSEEAMRSVNGDSGKVPTILIDGRGGNEVLTEPTDRDLSDALRRCSGRAAPP
jgi:mycoredoxin